MKFNRQYVLLGLLGLVAVANMADWLVNSLLQGPLQERRSKQEQLQTDIQKRQDTLKATREAGKQLDGWKRQSLPADREVARSFYRSWLVELLEGTGFRSPFVDSGSPVNRQGLYVAFPFTARGQASLDQLTSFLFDFSESGYLHRMQTISITPRSNSTLFDISMTIEALQLPGVNESSEIPERQVHRLSSATVDQYAAFSRQNIFGVENELNDPFENTFVTAIIESDGQPQVWIAQRLIDQTDRLQTGEVLEIDGIEARVLSILERDVVIELGGRPVLLTIGESFAEALELPAEY